MSNSSHLQKPPHFGLPFGSETFFDGIFQKIYCFRKKKESQVPAKHFSHLSCDQTKRTMTLGNQVIYLMTL